MVKAGDRLISFDPAKIKAAGHPATTMLVITEEAEGCKAVFHTGKTVAAGWATCAALSESWITYSRWA